MKKATLIFLCFSIFIALLACTLIYKNFDTKQANLQNKFKHPFSYAYHGILINDDLKEIRITEDFLKKSQQQYIDYLLKQSPKNLREDYIQFSKELSNNSNIDEIEKVNIRYAFIQGLTEKIKPKDIKRIKENNDLLRLKFYKLYKKKNPYPKNKDDAFSTQSYLLLSTYNNLSWLIELMKILAAYWESQQPEPPTEYIGECLDNGVPQPPDWGDEDWVYQDELNDVFIVIFNQAHVYAYESQEPEGICIALPRINPLFSRIENLGIICLGKNTGKACFWDNQENDIAFNIELNEEVDIERFAGGEELYGGEGGTCTACHAGENPFVIHPETALDLAANGYDMSFVNNEETSGRWHEPIVSSLWPDNPGPTSVLDNEELGSFTTTVYEPLGGWFPWWREVTIQRQSCQTCHKLPDTSSSTMDAYCNNVLSLAADRTMPPGEETAGWNTWGIFQNETQLAYKDSVALLREACN